MGSWPLSGHMVPTSRRGQIISSSNCIEYFIQRSKVRMMALCPCLVDTPLSRAAMNVDKDEKFSSEMGMRALESSEVAEAFERLVVSGGTGEALLVYPGLTFYWPNVQFWMFNIYCYISKFLIMVRNVFDFSLSSSKKSTVSRYWDTRNQSQSSLVSLVES